MVSWGVVPSRALLRMGSGGSGGVSFGRVFYMGVCVYFAHGGGREGPLFASFERGALEAELLFTFPHRRQVFLDLT